MISFSGTGPGRLCRLSGVVGLISVHALAGLTAPAVERAIDVPAMSTIVELLGSSTIGVSVVRRVPVGNGLEKFDVVRLVLPVACGR